MSQYYCSQLNRINDITLPIADSFGATEMCWGSPFDSREHNDIPSVSTDLAIDRVRRRLFALHHRPRHGRYPPHYFPIDNAAMQSSVAYNKRISAVGVGVDFSTHVNICVRHKTLDTICSAFCEDAFR